VKDFAQKNYKHRSVFFSGRKKLRYVLLVLLGVFYFYKGPDIEFFSQNLKNLQVVCSRLIRVDSPSQWLFFDTGNESSASVGLHGSLGLRVLLKSSAISCNKISKQLFATKLPVVWVSKPGKYGLCRFDIGPFIGMKNVFVARDILYQNGFYGKIDIVSWLNSFRSFSV